MLNYKVKVTPKSNGTVETLEDFSYKDIVVPKGFESNGATIEYVFYFLIIVGAIFGSMYLWLLVVSLFVLRTPFHPKHVTASVIHDYMCSTGQHKKGDKYFLEILLETDDLIRAYTKYIGVVAWHIVTLKY